ncbi:MAG: ABC transporter ATP-binding protein [Sulfurovum sp.]|nr:ABC transporter ATP-binding protein [Sulfurovum sp.]
MDKNINITSLVLRRFKEIVDKDRKNILYMLYYSIVEGILLLVIPLTSAFIINSVLAHSTLSIGILSLVLIVIFSIIVGLQILKEYMIEKFEQKIFIEQSIEISQLALDASEKSSSQTVDKYMNYFFDVLSIQKLFPVLLLNGTGLVVKIVIALLLLLFFNLSFFLLGLFFVLAFLVVVKFLGKGAAKAAIESSNAKHESIYYLQSIPQDKGAKEEVLQELDSHLVSFVKARQKIFSIVIKQLTLAFMAEGMVLSVFFILGGYLVFEGLVPIGEFVAAEIIIISVVYALRDFMKQIYYVYEMVEGFYKIDKLSNTLEGQSNEIV